MATSRRLLLHLAACAAGWGIVTALSPARTAAAESRAATKTSVRDILDREQGEKLLHRLAPDIAPAPQPAVQRTPDGLSEIVVEEDPSSPFSGGMDEATLTYLQEKIRGTFFGENGPDLSYALQHGRMDSPQILAILQRTFPDLAGESLFVTAVFFELSAIDPTRAWALLDELSEDERFESFTGGFVSQSENLDPEARLAWSNLASMLVLDTDPPFAVLATKLGKPDYYTEYGNDYTEWLLDQSPSKGREAMVEALIEHLDRENPLAATALRKRLSTR